MHTEPPVHLHILHTPLLHAHVHSAHILHTSPAHTFYLHKHSAHTTCTHILQTHSAHSTSTNTFYNLHALQRHQNLHTAPTQHLHAHSAHTACTPKHAHTTCTHYNHKHGKTQFDAGLHRGDKFGIGCILPTTTLFSPGLDLRGLLQIYTGYTHTHHAPMWVCYHAMSCDAMCLLGCMHNPCTCYVC